MTMFLRSSVLTIFIYFAISADCFYIQIHEQTQDRFENWNNHLRAEDFERSSIRKARSPAQRDQTVIVVPGGGSTYGIPSSYGMNSARRPTVVVNMADESYAAVPANPYVAVPTGIRY